VSIQSIASTLYIFLVLDELNFPLNTTEFIFLSLMQQVDPLQVVSAFAHFQSDALASDSTVQFVGHHSSLFVDVPMTKPKLSEQILTDDPLPLFGFAPRPLLWMGLVQLVEPEGQLPQLDCMGFGDAVLGTEFWEERLTGRSGGAVGRLGGDVQVLQKLVAGLCDSDVLFHFIFLLYANMRPLNCCHRQNTMNNGSDLMVAVIKKTAYNNQC
jgi:hypothetical protein